MFLPLELDRVRGTLEEPHEEPSSCEMSFRPRAPQLLICLRPASEINLFSLMTLGIYVCMYVCMWCVSSRPHVW